MRPQPAEDYAAQARAGADRSGVERADHRARAAGRPREARRRRHHRRDRSVHARAAGRSESSRSARSEDEGGGEASPGFALREQDARRDDAFGRRRPTATPTPPPRHAAATTPPRPHHRATSPDITRGHHRIDRDTRPPTQKPGGPSARERAAAKREGTGRDRDCREGLRAGQVGAVRGPLSRRDWRVRIGAAQQPELSGRGGAARTGQGRHPRRGAEGRVAGAGARRLRAISRARCANTNARGRSIRTSRRSPPVSPKCAAR